jgi:formylmethanofuran dehydrogenase subunit E
MTDNHRASCYPKPILEPDWEAARRFHGHLGPWLALGMKMGAAAMTHLDARPHFGIAVRVTCRLAPPVSCLIDGLQWMTGATYGKQNLTAEEGDAIVVRAEHKESGRALLLTPNPETPANLAAWLTDMGDEAASRYLYDLPDAVLFTVREEQAA